MLYYFFVCFVWSRLMPCLNKSANTNIKVTVDITTIVVNTH